MKRAERLRRVLVDVSKGLVHPEARPQTDQEYADIKASLSKYGFRNRTTYAIKPSNFQIHIDG